ncbi:hypothetical protein [Asanoa iriomotensis]|uniref:Uncharacterized protein n=1 Tax=Asanoa iriomotensis TaxID=234613 RepID=A0ABQ4C042_9ACTN|nr:hypothetical protein [Asanoa iriomotensis]GIF56150.1 hypothetical protein Air01nite_22450 [Asanoa iriomotensis]
MNLLPGPGSVSPCFHPGDDAGEAYTAGVNLCHHAADDLAVDLHLTLTAADERDLAGLAERA